MFNKILIANRGEIACRVISTCRRLGIVTVAVYSDADACARHVLWADEAWHIGGPRPADSYLRADKIIATAKASGAEAIHPGYGFLSENAGFAQQCEAAGITFIGPTPAAIKAMGSKSAAKQLMEQAGVPVVPGYHGADQNPEFLFEQANSIGYPLLIKAVAGGGGKGMRLVSDAEAFMAQLEAARREARNAFGEDAVLLERFVQQPHHIEFQVFGDSHGNFVHLYERECSIQRRHQKILEETPSPILSDPLRRKMGGAAVAAARAVNYRGAGTIEFIVGADRVFYFMEMNTRLQVEHPITELTTGLDLVEWQLRVAAGEPLPLPQQRIVRSGHAIEVRLCAESPEQDFLPETGQLKRFVHPEPTPQVRLDTGVTEGDAIPVFYDPMIAKLIVWGTHRDEAIGRLQRALADTAVIGVTTNIGFLQTMAHHPDFLAGGTDTGFIARHLPALLHKEEATPEMALIAAVCRQRADSETAQLQAAQRHPDPTSPWLASSGWRLNGASQHSMLLSDPLRDNTIAIGISGSGGDYRFALPERAISVTILSMQDERLRLRCDGRVVTARVLRHENHYTVLLGQRRYELLEVQPLAFESLEEVPGGRLTALMPGRIVKVFVKAGDAVTRGQPLITMEAMKMEHTIHSPLDGVIEQVFYAADGLVEADAALFAFATGANVTAGSRQ